MNENMSKFKPDWLEARQRMEDWWAGKPVDRAILQVSAPRHAPQPTRTEYLPSAPAKYTDPATVFNNLEYHMERTFYGGESFPSHFVYLGPMFTVAFFGCEPHFMPNTTWYEPCFESLEELLANLEFRTDNQWWQLVKEITRQSLERADGSYIVSNSMGVCAIIDMLAELVGKENLLLAMAEDPDLVLRARDLIAGFGQGMADEMHALMDSEKNGTVDWMNVWCPQKVVTTQCDYSVMISPQMFEDFVLPDLEATFALCDHGIYHLDGEEQIRHLDLLLSIDKLRIIQWQPSSRVGQPDYANPKNWLELFRRIQAAGKSVLFYCEPAHIPEVLDKLDPRLLVLNTYCASEEEAQDVLKLVERVGC